MTTFESSNRPAVARWIVPLLVVLLIAVSIFFRFWRLGNVLGLNGDEAEYGADALDILHGRAIPLHTSTGNLKNILYYLPVIALHALFPPSIILLRITAVICGIAAIALNYWLCSRIFGRPVALMTTLLIAVLPEDIVQSRFGWDPCESVLVDLLAMYGSLEIVRTRGPVIKPVAWTALACVAAFIVHPANLFGDLLFPVALALRFWPAMVAFFRSGARPLKAAVVALIAVAVVGGGAAAFRRQIETAARYRGTFSRGFVLDYASLFDGRTVYEYAAGYPEPVQGMDAIDALAVLPWLAAAAFAAMTLRKRDVDCADRFLAIGWIVSGAAFWLVAGNGNLAPGNERYGLCLIPPGVWLFVRALDRFTEKRCALRAGAALALVAVAAAFLFSFYACYFRFIMTTGGDAQEQLHTGPTDLKQAAFYYVASQCPRNRNCFILTHSWWTYQPCRYFAETHPNISVPYLPKATPADRAAIVRALRDGNVWTIDFVIERDAIVREFARRNVAWSFIEVPDYGGHPILLIGHPTPAAEAAPATAGR